MGSLTSNRFPCGFLLDFFCIDIGPWVIVTTFSYSGFSGVPGGATTWQYRVALVSVKLTILPERVSLKLKLPKYSVLPTYFPAMLGPLHFLASAVPRTGAAVTPTAQKSAIRRVR